MGKEYENDILYHYTDYQAGQLLDETYVLTLPETDREIADQINRRTEFQVLTTDYQMY